LQLAQYQGVIKAACRLHDEHLSVGCYHLFRLPEEAEQDLHALVQDHADEESANAIVRSTQKALNTLRSIARTNKTTNVGPTAVGRIKDLNSEDVLSRIAAAYFSAFSNDVRTYPYLLS
jgi:hypothetical protein